MGRHNMLSPLGYSLWVAICAAAPEFIFQGTRLFIDHLSWTNLMAAGLIGMLLAFFVEPILERLRQGRWRPVQHGRGGPVRNMAIALLFGFLAVCIHEALNAWFNIEHAPDARQAHVVGAVNQVVEWAWVPFITMLALFVGRLGRPAAILAGLASCAGAVAVGFAYGWSLPEIVVTAVPCCAFMLVGEVAVTRSWDHTTFLRLPLLLAGIASVWLAAVGLVHLGLTLAKLEPWLLVYDWDSLRADFLFFAGWAIGLFIAPNPVAVAD